MTRDDRDWLTDDFPELRDGPPWVMEEMILRQMDLAAPILGDDRPGVALEPSSAKPLLSSLLQSAVAVQLMTLGLVELAGTNPDLIRREERAYREAALIGDSSADW
jgi:hypothetical protein